MNIYHIPYTMAAEILIKYIKIYLPTISTQRVCLIFDTLVELLEGCINACIDELYEFGYISKLSDLVYYMDVHKGREYLLQIIFKLQCEYTLFEITMGAVTMHDNVLCIKMGNDMITAQMNGKIDMDYAIMLMQTLFVRYTYPRIGLCALYQKK